MRIRITLSSNISGLIDFNYQHQILSIIYKFISDSNPDFASWLHEQGFVCKNDKRFKLFVFSGITFNRPVRPSNAGSRKGFSFNASNRSSFTFSFEIASPVGKFVQHLIEGLFYEGNEVTLGKQNVYIFRVETLPDTESIINGSKAVNLRPLESPIFVKKPMPQGESDIYLYPGDDEYNHFLNTNLMNKYETLYGKPYEGELLQFEFKNSIKKTEKRFTLFKPTGNGKMEEIHIKGTLKPFTVSGPKELISIGLECGFGQNNSMGCGYVIT